MIDAISHVNVWVDDQEEAKAFYTEKLGFEVREDAKLEEFGGYRWLTVGPSGQPDVNVILSAATPPAIDADTAKRVMALVNQGAMGPGIFRTADCRKTSKELQERGVEFTQEPDERFYGIDAGFRDPFGNEWRLVQPIEYDIETVPGARANSG
ncbi:MAG TPA: VOC family protein [Solirubrobacterales bacterium]|nr:VOC family protein [Solirubrobacterales bacterium]